MHRMDRAFTFPAQLYKKTPINHTHPDYSYVIHYRIGEDLYFLSYEEFLQLLAPQNNTLLWAAIHDLRTHPEYTANTHRVSVRDHNEQIGLILNTNRNGPGGPSSSDQLEAMLAPLEQREMTERGRSYSPISEVRLMGEEAFGKRDERVDSRKLADYGTNYLMPHQTYYQWGAPPVNLNLFQSYVQRPLFALLNRFFHLDLQIRITPTQRFLNQYEVYGWNRPFSLTKFRGMIASWRKEHKDREARVSLKSRIFSVTLILGLTILSWWYMDPGGLNFTLHTLKTNPLTALLFASRHMSVHFFAWVTVIGFIGSNFKILSEATISFPWIVIQFVLNRIHQVFRDLLPLPESHGQRVGCGAGRNS